MKIVLNLLVHENKGNLQNLYFPLSIGLISEYIKANIKNVENKLAYRFRPMQMLKKVDFFDKNIKNSFFNKISSANKKDVLIHNNERGHC